MSTTWDTHRRSLAVFSSASLLGLLAACGSDEPQVETHHPAEVERELMEEAAAQQEAAEDAGLDAHTGPEEGRDAEESESDHDSGADADPAAQFAELLEEVFDQLAGTVMDDF